MTTDHETNAGPTPTSPAAALPLDCALDGFRFSLCRDADEMERALELRRKVYAIENAFTLPIPDRYDAHSWVLVAEDLETGEAVGTVRLTPLALGPLECQEHFTLPAGHSGRDAVELGRFAILPQYRGRALGTPVVFLGLLKLAVQLLLRVGTVRVVAGAMAPRIAMYQWLSMESTGMTASYAGLKDQEVTLLTCNLREALARHELRPFLLDEPGQGEPATVDCHHASTTDGCAAVQG